ncbi:MAG: hypothetical protein NVS4B10_22720 [Myxococcales bacterium]
MGWNVILDVSFRAPPGGAGGGLVAHEGPGAFAGDRFLSRARVLFYARLGLLLLGLGIVGLPGWSLALGTVGPSAFVVYFGMVAYSAANYALLPRRRAGRAATFVTLCADLCVLSFLVAATGGLRSPLLAAQLLFTTPFLSPLHI